MHRVPAHHGMPTPDTWASLTVSAQKRQLFEEDLYFREGWADVEQVMGGEAAPTLSALALLSFKCDGLVGRRMRPTLEYLTERGFRVVGLAPLHHNRQSIRELWRYNWHVYPTDRLTLMTRMHTATETLLLILRDLRYDGRLPAAVRIADLKGSANPAKRSPDALRSVLEPPNQVINFVHVADEPADVVRETAIFLDRPERLRLLRQVGEHFDDDLLKEALRQVDALEARFPSNDFDLRQALRRVTTAARLSEPDTGRLLAACSGTGEPLSFDELAGLIDPDDPDVDIWDFVRIATEVLPAERLGCGDLLPATTASDWGTVSA
ncbi:hypothetical protein [Streptosporangium sp. NPDC049376]|uniref:hypothetical protein n=1 Tax=Streptosporangium sp. NPDC049376 TaxID=3366192 RepID=UPI003795FC32